MKVHDELPARAGGTLKTITKAVSVLALFTIETPEFRLSELAREAGMDKVTTMRVLATLGAGGYVEQHPETKKYRLGTAVLRLARVREATVPIGSQLQPILDALTVQVGETSHACLFTGAHMMTIAIAEPSRAARAVVALTQPLPVYATASGLAYLAYTTDIELEQTVARLSFAANTAHTIRSERELRQRLGHVRTNGCAISARTMEEDVTGIAAPIFDWNGRVQATLAAACVADRLTPKIQAQIERAVLRAALDATRALGGTVPAELVKISKGKGLQLRQPSTHDWHAVPLPMSGATSLNEARSNK